MYVIECKAKNNGEVFFYTTRSGRHDIGPRIAAHEFRDGAVAHLRAEDLRQSPAWSAGLELNVVRS